MMRLRILGISHPSSTDGFSTFAEKVLIVGIVALWILSSKALAQDTFYSAVQALQKSSDGEGWKRLERKLVELRDGIEKQLEELPYENRIAVAKTGLLQSLANAEPGTHSRWMNFRIASDSAPPTDCVINQCAAVIHSNLMADPTAPSSLKKQKNYRKRWDGYIYDSVVVVDGSVEMDGYIYNSLVVCTGPVTIHSYISNSLVVSTYTGKEFSVDTKDGYISHSIVAAHKCRPGSARNCVIFGDADGDDFRGAQVKSWHLISRQVESLGVPHRTFSDADEPAPIRSVAKTLEELLAAEDQVSAAMFAEQLTDAILTRSQIELLLAEATATTSDAKRIVLWHAIRLSRDAVGQQYLRQALTENSPPEQQIRFLQTMKNPTIDDVPLIIEVYRSSSKQEKVPRAIDDLDNVQEQVMRVASMEWKRIVVDTSRDPELDEKESARRRVIHERRLDRALEGQANLLRWIVRHGTTDEHRLQAFGAARKVASWPNQWKWMEEARLDDDLLASSKDPMFRVKVLDQFSQFIDLKQFLDSESREVDAVRLAALRGIRRSIIAAQGAPVGYSGQYEPILRHVASFDESAEVREAASKLLDETIRKPRQ